MKLELNEIAGYLAYSLRVQMERLKYPIGTEIVYLTVNNIDQIESPKFWRIKPILRPLSDLTPDQFNELRKITSRVEIGSNYIWFSGAVSLTLAQDVLTWLYKNHFDHQLLICQGKAINMNDLPPIKD